MMRSLAKLGRRTDALAHYRELCELLRKELDTTAEAATLECCELIRNGASDLPAPPRSHRHDRRPDQDPAAAKHSIVVLPFANLSNDPEQEYFSDGLTEDLIQSLSRIPNLFVIARQSAFTYKGKAVKIQDIGRELGVKYVLEGSARRAADRVRINAQLIDARAGGHIWADRFDRNFSDIFAVQDEVTWKIVEALRHIAEARGRSLLELAFGWLLARPTVASVIAGATRAEQVEANVKAIAHPLTPDELADISHALQ